MEEKKNRKKTRPKYCMNKTMASFDINILITLLTANLLEFNFLYSLLCAQLNGAMRY